jgi:uncharacterized membrane protein
MESKNTNPTTLPSPNSRHERDRELSILTAYSGPLPPAAEFAAYEKAVPGAGKIILEAFVEESAHRRAMEKSTLQASVTSDRLGTVTSTLITLALVGIGAWLIFVGKEISGLVALVSVVGLRFWVSRKQPDPPADHADTEDQS